ncbi:MAG: MFS transporter [Spirochaetia bacterium]|jgi:MFS family permease|nr:MFS transporter [Spirochaetia bacterium]
MSDKKEGFKAYMGLTFLIGFGFFTMGLMDPLYDTYVPAFLGKYIESRTLIGAVMTLDNVLQLFLIPIVAVWSDRTRTRIGRRMPFILVMLPASAVFFGLLPWSSGVSLGALITMIFLLNIFKTSVRGPVVALMPDTIPGEFRSEANGVINTMGGIGTIIGTLGLARLMDIDMVLPLIGRTKDVLPFPIAGFFVVLAVIILFIFVRERNHEGEAIEKHVPVMSSIKAVVAQKDKSALLILISLFLWFSAHAGVVLWLGIYLRDVLGASAGQMALPQGVAGISYALTAIPMGYLAHKYGRRTVIRGSLIGLFSLTGLFTLLNIVGPSIGLGGTTGFYLFLGLMLVYGVFWGSVITNSFPMLWQMSTFGNIGIFTGLYYTFSQSANILAPPLTGLVIDIAKALKLPLEYQYTGIFAFACILQIAAFIVMAKVRKGEPGDVADEPQTT